MVKKIAGMVLFNGLMILTIIAIASPSLINLSFLNFSQDPIRLGFCWAVLALWIGIFGYFNRIFLAGLQEEMRHRESLMVQSQEIKTVPEAQNKLNQSKRNNPKLSTMLDKVIDSVLTFQSKTDIMNQLLASNGQKIKDWSCVSDFNHESEKEILIYVRQVIDSGIIFDDPNEEVGSEMYCKTQEQITEYNKGIQEIIAKYDEFLHVIKKILEENLHSTGIVATDSLDITIQSLKQVYGIDEYGIDQYEEVMNKYGQEVGGGL